MGRHSSKTGGLLKADAPESDLNRVLLRNPLNGRTSNFVNTVYIF
jgi:hypothetical protein